MSNPNPTVELELDAAKQLLNYVASKPLCEVLHHFNHLSVAIRAAETGVPHPGSVADVVSAKRESMLADAELRRQDALGNALSAESINGRPIVEPALEGGQAPQ